MNLSQYNGHMPKLSHNVKNINDTKHMLKIGMASLSSIKENILSKYDHYR